MPIRPRRQRGPRVLALITAGIVVAGLLGAGSAATAVARPEHAVAAKQLPSRVLGAGRYVVVLRQPAATRYHGGVAGLPSTRVKAGTPFNARSARVLAYSGFLAKRQNTLARSIGARVMTRTTIASNSFTARLSRTMANQLSNNRQVLMLVKDTAFHTDTWNTPTFLGLEGPGGQWAQQGGVAKAGAGVVVGVLDTGIWPESASFAGTKVGPHPTGSLGIYRQGNDIYFQKADGGTFHGFCQPGQKWTLNDCTSKLVGARYYPQAFLDSTKPGERDPHESISARDGEGHGSHTAGTAAGNHGVPATVEGQDFGTISGMAPAAKIAAYKVCFADTDPDTGGCYTSSTLDAVDDAVADGVDVINFSISGATDTVIDAVEFAFMGAAAAGVFVATSAGNSGPTASTVAHNSPWETTVAASTHFNFENTVILGNGARYKGASISKTGVASTGLVNATASGVTGADAVALRLCGPGTLDPAKATGKIVICLRGGYDRVAKSAEVKRAGGVGMLLANVAGGATDTDADFHSVPTVHVGEADGVAIAAYAAGPTPTASIVIGDQTNTLTTPLPQIAGFSSRGPAIANDSDLIKPDISAPGVSVLAAVSPPTNSGRSFDIYSGTSMSSPHIAGLAAFMLGKHPEWSPMTVKSAMMTTAYDLKKPDGSPDTNPFDQGAGHVDPTRFFNPGLVVTSTPSDWLRFYEGQGLDVGVGIEPLAATDLNTPSLAQGQVTATTSITRTFTGLQTGTWNVAVDVPGFSATPDHPSVTIDSVGQPVPVTFTFTRTTAPLGAFATGFVTLSGPTTVRLPVALRPVSVRAPGTVRGTGGSGSTTVSITAGYTGDLDIAKAGLAKATTDSSTVAAGANVQKPITIPADTKVARFDLDAADNNADLDLYVYRTNAAGTPTALVGQSATSSADETVTLAAPAAGPYLVVIDGFAAPSGSSTIPFRYDQFQVAASGGLGSLTVSPNPVPVVQGATTSYTASWSGLSPGRYLGLFEYTGSLAPTYLYVDVP